MIGILNKRVLLSLGMIVFVAAIVIGATGAFFSDTETSTGNTFTAGAIDLKIDNESYYNGIFSTSTSWLTPADLDGQLFFSFNDLKPGDWGEDTISLHVNNNDAYACVDVRLDSDDDNGLTEPEEEDGDTTDGDGEGELASAVNFFWWADDGDNVFEVGETLLPSGALGTLNVGQVATVALADSEGGIFDGPLTGEQTYYIGKAWCFGDSEFEAYPQDSDTGPDERPVICDGSDVNNVTQTDSMTATISFMAVQSRNNDNFQCSAHLGDAPQESEGPFVGAVLGDYSQPTGGACDVTVSTTIQDGVDEAESGDTVCVPAGTYAENVNITTDNLTLAGDGATNTSTIDGRVRIDATGVTVQGFNILGASVPAEGVNGIYVVSGSDDVTISDNRIDGDAHTSGLRIGVHFEVGGTTDVVVMNNVIENWDSTGLYLNPTAGPVSITFNDFFANNVGIGSSGPNNVTVTNNDFVGNIAEAIGMDDSAAVSGIAINVNNFTPAGAGNNVNSYGVTPADATNNWWDSEAAGDRTNDGADIDVTSPAGAPFAQN